MRRMTTAARRQHDMRVRNLALRRAGRPIKPLAACTPAERASLRLEMRSLFLYHEYTFRDLCVVFQIPEAELQKWFFAGMPCVGKA